MDLPFGNELPQLDVLIVGGGLSGLTSAVKILSKQDSLNVKIIEEQNAPGGQLSAEGTCFVKKEQSELIAFINELNVQLNKHPEEDATLSRCWEIDRGLTAIPAKFELWRYIQMLDLRMSKFTQRYQLKKRMPTMERHICQNLFFNRSRKFMYNLVLLASGRAAKDINYDEFMCLCSSWGGLNVLVELFLTMPETVLNLSSKSLLHALLQRLKGVEIACNVKATEVRHFKNYVLVTDSAGQRHIAEAVILAIPWDRVSGLEFDPQIPNKFRIETPRKEPNTVQITQYYLRYKSSYWIQQGYSGHFLNVDPLMVGFEPSPKEYCGYLMQSQEAAEEDAPSAREIVLDLLAKHFGQEMLSPEHYTEKSCELSRVVPKPQLESWHRVIWSSSASGAASNRNLMAGAVESGLRAAIHALFVIRPQVVGWQDLSDVHQKNRYAREGSHYLSGLLSRLNLYNIAFYTTFAVGIIFLLSFGYSRAQTG